jgi:hypothetical protein
VREPLKAAKQQKKPTDRAKKGSKHHVLSDANSIPLAQQVTAAAQEHGIQLEVVKLLQAK